MTVLVQRMNGAAQLLPGDDSPLSYALRVSEGMKPNYPGNAREDEECRDITDPQEATLAGYLRNCSFSW